MDCVSETITKMIESLPKGMQDRVLEEIKPIISEALDEAEWQMQFERSQKNLVSIARKAKREIKQGGQNQWIMRNYDQCSYAVFLLESIRSSS